MGVPDKAHASRTLGRRLRVPRRPQAARRTRRLPLILDETLDAESAPGRDQLVRASAAHHHGAVREGALDVPLWLSRHFIPRFPHKAARSGRGERGDAQRFKYSGGCSKCLFDPADGGVMT